MLEVISDTNWLVVPPNSPQGSPYPFDVTHLMADMLCEGTIHWLYFPSDHASVSKYFGTDYRSSTVDTYDTLASDSMTSTYEYEGHTWNNFTHLQVKGQVTNLAANFPKRKIPYTGYTNVFTGDEYYAYRFHRFDQQWSQHYQYYVKNAGGERIYTHQMVMYYWNPKTGISRVGRLTWLTNEDNEVCGRYGTPIKDSAFYYLQTTRAFRVRERGAGQTWQYAGITEGLKLYDPILETSETGLRLYIHDTPATIFSRFCSYCRITDKMFQPLQGSWVRVGYDTPSTYLGRQLPQFKDVNYDVLFPRSLNRKVNWSEIAASAYQDLGMTSINGIANVSELFEMGSAVTSFLRTIESLPSKRIKAAASAYLAVHYGFKLTVLDAIELRKTLKQYTAKRTNLAKCTGTFKGEDSGVNIKATYQVFYDEFAQLKSSLDELLLISDFVLSTENWWDMVPYSFVVDWFVNVGDVLTALDNYYNITQRHKPICAGKSILLERQLKPSAIGLDDSIITGPITCSSFTRAYSDKLELPSLLPSVTVNPFNHLVEVGALVISRK